MFNGLAKIRRIGVLLNQPKTRKILQENSSRFNIHILPTLSYMCVDWELPELSIEVNTQPTPFVQRPIHATQMAFGSLGVTFLVDQNLQNYLSLWEWMKALAPPRDFGTHRAWVQPVTSSVAAYKEHASYSDATLILLTTQENRNIEVQFTDLFPVSLSKLKFNTTTKSAEELTCTATFRYRDYEFITTNIVK